MALTKSEKRKRNYALVRNAFQDDDLARKYRDIGDKRLYEELGIKITPANKDVIPELKPIEPKKQAYYDRKYNKLQKGLELGFEVADAKKLVNYSDKKIESSYTLKTTREQVFDDENRQQRMDLWSKWSSFTDKSMPPEIDAIARQYNRKAGLDDYAKYGYVAAFYLFVENGDEDKINEVVRPDKHDQYRVIYPTEVSA